MAPTARSTDYHDGVSLTPSSRRRSQHLLYGRRRSGFAPSLPPRIHGAFTLSELLVATALGLIVVAAAGSVFISHIRTTTVQTVQLRFQNDWARVSNLIETEVAEGASLTAAAGAGCGAGNRLFTINVPVIAGTTEAPTDITISYNQVGNNLHRCGPPINADGTLNPTPPANITEWDRLLLTNAVLTVNALNNRRLEYNLTLTDPNPPAFSAPFQRTFPAAGQFVQARTKVNYIDN